MRLYTFATRQRQQLIGAEVDGRLIDLNAAHAARSGSRTATLAGSMLELIRGGDATLKRASRAVAFAGKNPKAARRFTYELDKVQVLAPIPRPGKIFCSGLNYRSHVEENPAAAFLADPRFFVKVPSAVIGPGEAIRWPGERFQVDYEVELAVVIGRAARRLTQDNALAHVFGYTIFHDVSARWCSSRIRMRTWARILTRSRRWVRAWSPRMKFLIQGNSGSPSSSTANSCRTARTKTGVSHCHAYWSG